MNKATLYLVATCASIVVGLSATAASAQSYPRTEVQRDNTADPNSAPLVSPDGGKPRPVDRAEVRRDNTADPNSAPLVSPDGGKPRPVDPAEVRRDNTRDPG